MILVISTILVVLGLIGLVGGIIWYNVGGPSSSDGCIILSCTLLFLTLLIGFGALGNGFPVKETPEFLNINSNLYARSSCFVAVRVDNKIITSEKADVFMAKPEQLKVKKVSTFNSYDSIINEKTTWEIVVAH